MNLREIIRLKAASGQLAHSKNLLDVMQYISARGIPPESFSNGVIDDPSVGEGNADFVIFSQIFPAGTYTISAKMEGAGITNARFLSPVQFEGGVYVSYYGAYYADFVNGKYTFTMTQEFCVGLCLVTDASHQSNPGKLYDIQLERGSEATPYVPYR